MSGLHIMSGPMHVPPNLIPAGCDAIAPEMLPLVQLTAEEIARIAAATPGGAANIQDIYPLTPLQEGMLFHHMLGGAGDPYLGAVEFSFDSRERLDRYVAALQAVIDRHDILRTAMVWESLQEPVQVVRRRAALPVEECDLDPADGDVAAQLFARFSPRQFRIDVRQAPMMRLHVAYDRAHDRWLAVMLRHHLTGDQATFEAVDEEIDAHLSGKTVDSIPPRPFRDVVYARRAGIPRHEAYFRELLAGVEEPTAPYGLLDMQRDGTGIEEARMTVAPAIAVRVRERARALRVNVGSLIHVAWALVLARVSGRDDVVFGTVLSGGMQGGEGAGRAMGVFINTLPVRIRVGDTAARAVVRQTLEQLLNLQQHDDASLALAQRASGVPAPTPLFTALLNYRHTGGAGREPARGQEPGPGAGAGTGPREGIRLLHWEQRSNYPVGLSVEDSGADISFTARVDESIDPMRVCQAMLQALESLTEVLESDPARPLRGLDVLPALERQQVLRGWNQTALEYPRETCIHELFEQQVARTPDAVAVVCDGTAITYRALNQRANRLAHYLRHLGVGPDRQVAISLPRGLEMMVAVWAVLKAGGAYVPLDPAYPVERLRIVLKDSAAAAVLTTSDGVHLFAGMEDVPLPIVDLTASAAPPIWSAYADSNPRGADVGLTSEHLAYVIYTSGSTGAPKGVMNRHVSLTNRLWWGRRAWDVAAHETVLGQTSLGFDGHVRELFLPLLAGARTVLLGQDREKDPREIIASIRRERVGTLNLVPSLLHMLVERPELAACTTLTRVLCGGETMPGALLERLYERVPGVTLHHMYGPSEAATATVALNCRGTGPNGNPPIGRPIANTRIYILDRNGRPAPVGVPGELHVAGAGEARGYTNRADLTAERFVPDPFAADGGRMYRTGDLTRWLPDGTIEFLGRNDFQVKIRGRRIETGEIEAQLAKHDAVRDAVVTVHEDAPGEKRLIAYYTIREGDVTTTSGDIGAEVLRAHLASRLPDYMLPAAFVRLESLPLTSSGKLNRRALPAPGMDAYASRGYEAPVGEIETALAEIWSTLLTVERVGRRDNFFDLGGHSLLAVRAITRLQQRLGIDAALKDLFDTPVLTAFARRIATLRATTGRTTLPKIEAADRSRHLPLSFAQQRLWFVVQLGMSRSYHMSKRLRLRGRLDRPALRRALQRIVARHESLRTTFHVVDGAPVQRITSAGDFDFMLREYDLGWHADSEEELRRLIQQEHEQPFDLSNGPLIRARIVRLKDDDHVLLLTMHHIVSDGWSMGVLFSEFRKLYAAFRAGQPDPLPELTTQYADYAVWQRHQAENGVLERQAEYWRQRLTGAPEVLQLPTDFSRTGGQEHTRSSVPIELDEALTARLKALSRQHGTTLFMTLLAGWAAVLSRLSVQDDVVIGTPAANRGRPEIEDAIGFYVNLLPVRLDLCAAPTVADLLAQVKARTVEAQHNVDLPFEHVVEMMQPARSMERSPLFQQLFVWGNAEYGAPDLPGLTVTEVGLSTSSLLPSPGLFDGVLTLTEIAGRIRGAFGYSTALFRSETAERYAGYLRSMLDEMTAHPAQRLDRLTLLPAAERALVVDAFNATKADYGDACCIHELFEAQAASRADAAAVVFEDQVLSYAALNQRANRLAHALIEWGVGPDARVALCVEPGLEMMVGVMGVLKAGAAYVPLDPSHPIDRLRYMLADSGAAVLLTARGLAGQSAANDLPIVTLDIADAYTRWPDTNPRQQRHYPERHAALSPDHLAYVIYTSGSTGDPKGVMNSHRNVWNMLAWSQALWRLDAGEAVLQNIPYNFDASVRELFWPLAIGARLVLPRPDKRKEPGYLIETIRRESIAAVHCTPSALRMYLDHPDASACISVSRVMCGGEALSPGLINDFHDRWTNATLYHGYGPTETTVGVTGQACGREDAGKPARIGRPRPNTRVYVLDATAEPAPVGVAGELYIGGQVARGYVGRPVQTAERFVPDPYAPDKGGGGRLYRTGDVGRWHADGTIEFLGRNDDQVKVLGNRVELGEITARLREHPQVREAVVLARANGANGANDAKGANGDGVTSLVAYFTSAVEIRPRLLRSHLAAALPAYMVPAAYVRLESLPKLSHGKIDRRALPPPPFDAYVTTEYAPPIGDTETALVEMWADLLGVERVGRHDHFFDIGGHSLLATRLVARINREMGTELALRDVFDAPVLADLAMRIVKAQLAQFDPEELETLTASLVDEEFPFVKAEAP